MAKKASNTKVTSTFKPKKGKKKGNATKKASSNKNSKNYEKPYIGQGR